MHYEKIISAGFILILLGLVITISGTFLSLLKGDEASRIETGGVILIGPIPIIFGNSKHLVLISIAGALVLMIFYFLIARGKAI
ncbi:MAG: DUF131 domain-containing protein [Candidatus Methanofastidiosa archaeon]|jgi:uncharacterized protein (TIGR00304 family)|nr:DUF131 domain-containing protein [Candidatus Methanofastidiosa archaeon]HOM95655.1 DUF131 domain-containing protein [Methanofastidiosum sp.]HPC80924.1 DUF131 domain-containing protein [Methanofastidiosum sp.]HRS26094.1 DUF131 domain-containing protein [Methanofastidiosum sp.]